MFRRVWVLAFAMPFLMLSMPFLLQPSNQVVASEQTPVKNKVVFSTHPDSPDPNEVFNLVNQVRQDRGLQPLVGDESLGKIAADRAADMAQRQYYAHRNPDGKYYYDFFDTYDVRAGYSCENLDLVFVPDMTLFIKEWMGSTKGHRNCMLTNEALGAGYATTKLTLVQFNGTETTAYLVVALHANLYD